MSRIKKKMLAERKRREREVWKTMQSASVIGVATRQAIEETKVALEERKEKRLKQRLGQVQAKVGKAEVKLKKAIVDQDKPLTKKELLKYAASNTDRMGFNPVWNVLK